MKTKQHPKVVFPVSEHKPSTLIAYPLHLFRHRDRGSAHGKLAIRGT